MKRKSRKLLDESPVLNYWNNVEITRSFERSTFFFVERWGVWGRFRYFIALAAKIIGCSCEYDGLDSLRDSSEPYLLTLST